MSDEEFDITDLVRHVTVGIKSEIDCDLLGFVGH
jgi:hypothetical protein